MQIMIAFAKAKVALEAVKGEKMIAQLFSKLWNLSNTGGIKLNLTPLFAFDISGGFVKIDKLKDRINLP